MIGVLGGGQLGRMLALAGYPLGERFRFVDEIPDAPVADLGPLLVRSFQDPGLVEALIPGLKLVTYEFENVPVGLVESLEQLLPVFPSSRALAASQDRLVEKQLFRRLGVKTAPFAPVDRLVQLEEALHQLGTPAILKTRRLGYDGKGQYFIRESQQLREAWNTLGGVPLILEGYVPFERELSQISVRGRDGSLAFYPLVQNHHAHGILRLSIAPAPHLQESLQKRAIALATAVLQELNYVGVLTIELFQQGGELIANEMAPRVHNSGHWTIEGAETSQFENHLRAILGYPLGSPSLHMPSAMINLIGLIPDLKQVLVEPGIHVHLYGKSARRARKVGHVTLMEKTPELLQARLQQIQPLFSADG